MQAGVELSAQAMTLSPFYPTAQTVEVSLKSSGFWPEDAAKQILAQSQCEIGAAAAASEWEKRTGWSPFLMKPDAPVQSRPFNGTDLDGVLNLRAAAQEIAGLIAGTRALVEGTDFWLLASADPDDLAYEPPYTALRFLRPRAHPLRPGEIRVSARWGFCSELPPDVRQQILDAAKLVALTSVENLQSIASLSVDGFSKAFDVTGIITQQNLLQTWGKNFDKAMKPYTRTSAQ